MLESEFIKDDIKKLILKRVTLQRIKIRKGELTPPVDLSRFSYN